MERYSRIIAAVREGTPLFGMIRMGFSPEDIKQAVVECLQPYFENQDVLRELAVRTLVPEAMNVLKLREGETSHRLFEKCLSTYQLARRMDPPACFESCAAWQPQIADGLSRYWSILHLELDKSLLQPEEFLHECLRNIADIIEGATKPYLKVLLHQARIARGATTAQADVDSLDLGVVVGELVAHSGYGDLLVPSPWNVRLNQWRNIACHQDATIEGGDIVCWHGQAPNRHEIRLARGELLQVAHAVLSIYAIVRTAYTLFFADNVREIGRYGLRPQGRDEAHFVSLAAAIASQGFEIVECDKSDEEARLVVRDVSDLDPDKRRFHASQFLLHLWLLTRSARVTVEYREKNDTRSLLVSASSSTCEKIDEGKLDPLTLPRTMDMLDLKMGKRIPPLGDDQ